MIPYFSFEKELWANTDGATLTFNRFERFRDDPVLRHGGQGAPDEHRVDGTNVIRTGDHFTMWYHGMRPPAKDLWHQEEQQWVCVAKSHDGIEWEKPNLGLSGRKWGGAPDNVLPDVSRDCYGISVMRDGERYRLALAYPRPLNIDEPKTTFSIYNSDDGLRWKGRRDPCIEPQHFEPSCSLFSFRGRYWMLGQGVSPYYYMPDGSEIARVMFAYESSDLKKWKFHRKPAFAYPIPRHFIQAGVQNHAGASVVDRGRIAIGVMGQLWPADFSEKVRSTFGLVYSLDGRSWTEPFLAEPLLLPVEKSWEEGMLVQGAGLYSRGDYTYYWYVGFNGGNTWHPRGNCGICRVRRDGFSALHGTGQASCAVETGNVRVGKGETNLYVNVEASRKHPVEVALLHAKTRKKLVSASVMNSGVLIPAVTIPRGERDLIVSLRLHGKAKLYAFYCGPEVNTETYLNDWRE